MKNDGNSAFIKMRYRHIGDAPDTIVCMSPYTVSEGHNLVIFIAEL